MAPKTLSINLHILNTQRFAPRRAAIWPLGFIRQYLKLSKKKWIKSIFTKTNLLFGRNNHNADARMQGRHLSTQLYKAI